MPKSLLGKYIGLLSIVEKAVLELCKSKYFDLTEAQRMGQRMGKECTKSMGEQEKDVWTFGAANLPPSLFLELDRLRTRVHDLEDILLKIAKGEMKQTAILEYTDRYSLFFSGKPGMLEIGKVVQ